MEKIYGKNRLIYIVKKYNILQEKYTEKYTIFGKRIKYMFLY